ncbi:NADH-quinone oxidoreductase subunit NuoK [Muribaculum intestinale]|uniref:NADH-quinone oxidoreductase subunit NuoK n=1 Tax=Muribaculum intestinale TaxID=1796646 RepID=UPI00248B7D3A|nr:NADH-quinone oxidoreductase subunit NuoK [Muribaculum intestinale]
MDNLPIAMYIIPSIIMFCCGVYGFVTRKNLIAILISLELMLNAVDINFVVFNGFLYPGQLEGMMFTLFAIAIAAAETGLAIAIIVNLFRWARNIDIRDLNKMKF